MSNIKKNPPAKPMAPNSQDTLLPAFKPQDYITPGKHEISKGQFIKNRGREPGGQAGLLSIIRNLRASHSRREERCYALLKKIGIPCPKVLEVEEKRSKLGLVTSSKIVLEYLEGTVDLRLMSTLDCFAGLRADKAWRKRVVKEVAKWVRHMHRHRIYPQKLHFGNVLVKPAPLEAEVKVYFIDITGNIKGYWGLCGHKRRKDIGYLYRDARQWCTVREQILFMHEFLGTSKLSPRDRAFIRRMIRYTENKWGMKTSLGTPVEGCEKSD